MKEVAILLLLAVMLNGWQFDCRGEPIRQRVAVGDVRGE